MDKPMILLLIEDDKKECDIYRKIEKTREDIKFVAITDSNKEGIKYVKQYSPEGIILDLELNKGNATGTGFDFLKELKNLELENMPKIIVTTNICSDSVYNYLHKSGVDFVFYKKQINYSQENVINTLLLIREYKNDKIERMEIDKEQNKDNIEEKINKELDLIGVSTHLQGRKYLFDSIYYVIENYDKNHKVTTVQYLVGKYKKSSSTISRAMQNAILHAWRISSLEDLSTYYTAKINYETGVPTPTDLCHKM